MSRLNDADYVVDEIMQIFAELSSKAFASYLPIELIKSKEFSKLLKKLLPLNQDMETNYDRFRHDEGRAIIRAFSYAQVDELYQDSYDFEAPRFNEGAFFT